MTERATDDGDRYDAGSRTSVNGTTMYDAVHDAGRCLVVLHDVVSAVCSSFGNFLLAFAEQRRVISTERVPRHRAGLDRPAATGQMADDAAAHRSPAGSHGCPDRRQVMLMTPSVKGRAICDLHSARATPWCRALLPVVSVRTGIPSGYDALSLTVRGVEIGGGMLIYAARRTRNLVSNQDYGKPSRRLRAMTPDASPKRSPLRFFVLVFALSAPFWVLNAIAPLHLPVDNLPVTDIGATFVPMIAASVLVYREERLEGIRRLLKRAFDYRRITRKIWYVPIIFLMPLLIVLTYGVMRLIGLPLPAEWHIPLTIPLLFSAFFIAAAGEELGYMGYAIDPMQEQWGALPASLIMGTVWALWHYPSMIALGQAPALMAWGTLSTIGFRVLIVWVYNNAGKSVFAAILFHAVANTGRSVFPGGRPSYELADGAVGYSIIVITAVIVAFLWGAKTLTWFRYARPAV